MKPLHQSTPFALLTGASRGLGRAVAFELARRNIPLLLISLPGDGLEQTAQELAALGVETHIYETDLSEKENVYQLARWANDFPIHILINNAGFGGSGRFDSASPDLLDTMIRLNVTATVLLTRLLLPNLLRQPESFILNVSSIAAFSPVGFKTVYPATKKFVQHFSLGLREELRGTTVSVSVVHPGPMNTSADIARRIERQGWLAHAGLLSPEQVAQIALRQMFRRKGFILAGWIYEVMWRFVSLLPWHLKVRLFTNAVKKEV